MKNTWRHYLRRLAAVSVVGGSAAWSSAMCYAVTVLYQDNAGNAPYADGWQEGDDGDGAGGFGPWNFDGVSYNASAYNTQTVLNMDDGLKSGTSTSSPYNDIGKAWVLQNPRGPSKLPVNGQTGTDISQPGRTFPALQPGQTLSILIDNPIQRQFFRGYTIKLNSGPDASGCWQQDNCTTTVYDPGSITVAWGLGTFEYGTNGQWGNTTLFDTDTDSGVWIDFTLTTPTTYSFTMTPLDTNITPYTATGTLDPGLTIDWLELEFYNTDSDFYPVMVAGAQPTDFYVREMKITVADAPGLTGDFNDDGKVDAADYVMWRKDNSVGTFAEWQENFGAMQAGSGGAVPEPAACALVVTCGAGLIAAGARRRR